MGDVLLVHFASIFSSTLRFPKHLSVAHRHTAIGAVRLSPWYSSHSNQRILILSQAAQANVVNHVLDLFDAILDPVAPLPQRVVLEVQDLEAGVHVFDELRDLQRTAVVA